MQVCAKPVITNPTLLARANPPGPLEPSTHFARTKPVGAAVRNIGRPSQKARGYENLASTPSTALQTQVHPSCFCPSPLVLSHPKTHHALACLPHTHTPGFSFSIFRIIVFAVITFLCSMVPWCINCVTGLSRVGPRNGNVAEIIPLDGDQGARCGYPDPCLHSLICSSKYIYALSGHLMRLPYIYT